jgi:hypothetical protein
MKTIGHRSLSSFITVLLNIAWYAVALGIALLLCLAAASPFIDLSGGQLDIPVSFAVETSVISPALGVTDAHILDGKGSLKFSLRGKASLVAPAVTIALMLGLVLALITQLRAVFRTLRDGRPFVAANATRIRWIAAIVISGEVVRSVIVYVANNYAMTNFYASGLRFDARPDVSIFTILHGLIILVIAEVFRSGTRLDEDQSLTV